MSIEDVTNEFVVGFAFDSLACNVLLIEKTKPVWQAGLLNGIGGKRKVGESFLDAMIREAVEEAGLELTWLRGGTMTGTDNDGEEFEVGVFYAYDDEIYNFVSREEEKLFVHPVHEAQDMDIIPNLSYLIPMGVCFQHEGFEFDLRYKV